MVLKARWLFGAYTENRSVLGSRELPQLSFISFGFLEIYCVLVLTENVSHSCDDSRCASGWLQNVINQLSWRIL